MTSPRSLRSLGAFPAIAGLLLILGCATRFQHSRPSYSYFEPPAATDRWSAKISGWQTRERRLGNTESLKAPASVSTEAAAREPSASSEDLRTKYFSFRAEHKRAMARDVAVWIQEQARDHYKADGPLDHWATLEDTLSHNGDDCDGLELLVYHFLRDLGFHSDEVYRAIVFRPEDGQHHMVTFWFEDPHDPWVIDPTGAMVSGMPRMSDVPGWVPLKVFSENEEFTVGSGLDSRKWAKTTRTANSATDSPRR